MPAIGYALARLGAVLCAGTAGGLLVLADPSLLAAQACFYACVISGAVLVGGAFAYARLHPRAGPGQYLHLGLACTRWGLLAGILVAISLAGLRWGPPIAAVCLVATAVAIGASVLVRRRRSH